MASRMYPVHFIAYDLAPRPRGSSSAGMVHFPPDMVRLEKMVGGASLNFGYAIHLNPGTCVNISSITADLYFQGKQPASVALGIAADPESHVIHTGYKFPQGGVINSTIRGCLRLPLNLAGLETIERLRDGEQADFHLTMRGSALILDPTEKTWDACLFQVDGGMPMSAQVQVSRDLWTPQVRAVSPMGSILVEIPLATSRTPPWNAVWEQLDKAAGHLAQGGEGEWEGCIAKVRQALELRAKIEKIPQGPPKSDHDQDRRERLNGLAKALFHYSSLAVHADRHTTHWNRADAILAYSTLCAILAVQDP